MVVVFLDMALLLVSPGSGLPRPVRPGIRYGERSCARLPLIANPRRCARNASRTPNPSDGQHRRLPERAGDRGGDWRATGQGPKKSGPLTGLHRATANRLCSCRPKGHRQSPCVGHRSRTCGPSSRADCETIASSCRNRRKRPPRADCPTLLVRNSAPVSGAVVRRR